MLKGTLAGKTVLVTRPRAQSSDLARMLRRHGAQVLTVPAIRIADPTSWSALDQALKRQADYDTLIFTSANGVSRFFERAAKILKRRPIRPRRLYAIGPQTAKALRSRGWRGVGVPESYEGEALANRLGRVRGWKILIPRAQKARDVLPRTLRRRGAQVNVVEAYRTLGDQRGLSRIRRIVRRDLADIVTFTSSSTVEHFMKAAHGPPIRRFFQKAIAASIGPITSSTLRSFGIGRIIEGERYTAAGLVSAIVRSLRNGKH